MKDWVFTYSVMDYVYACYSRIIRRHSKSRKESELIWVLSEIYCIWVMILPWIIWPLQFPHLVQENHPCCLRDWISDPHQLSEYPKVKEGLLFYLAKPSEKSKAIVLHPGRPKDLLLIVGSEDMSHLRWAIWLPKGMLKKPSEANLEV